MRRRLCIGLAATVLAVGVLFVQHRAAGDGEGTSTTAAALVTTSRPAPTSVTYADPVPYRILPGEALSQIAARNGLTTDELARFNGITDPDAVEAGQQILIPAPSPTTTTAATRPTGPSTTTTLPVATTLPDDPAG